MTRSEALKLMRKAINDSEGSGHVLRFGHPPRVRFDPETGERYLTEPTLAYLECRDAKMRAIWSVWEKLPQIIAAMEAA